MSAPLKTGHPHDHRPGQPKRLILCCDGTWMDSLGAKGNEPPSNVTRISRAFRRTCSDGTHQVINYFPGVGTANAFDRIAGGAFGVGLDRDICEVYNLICTNYVDGDAIILIGYSRGAFTARSVADMIASIGLLTPEGLDHFYAIFDDYEHMGKTNRDIDQFLIPGLPKYNGERGQAKIEWEAARKRQYKRGLKELKYTRDTYRDGMTEIKIKALAVWDTVGTLGIPPAPLIGIHISNKVENAFQALALDEPRYAFRPSLWERLPGSTTNLKQVWFPGNHGNVGGGWHDQQMADITLAWMCDQLSTLGLEFNFQRLTAQFHETLRYSAAHPFPYCPGASRGSLLPSLPKLPLDSLKRSFSKLLRSSSIGSTGSTRSSGGTGCFIPHPPHTATSETLLRRGARPWGLGTIRAPTTATLSISTPLGNPRRPGRVLRVDETTNEDTTEPLVSTGERVHASARVRLACRGLGLDDAAVWACPALLLPTSADGDGKGGRWKLERGGGALSEEEEAAIRAALKDGPREVRMMLRGSTGAGPEGEPTYPAEGLYPVGEEDHLWKWVWEGKVEGEGQERMPQALALPEEPLVGYWERYLLGLTSGEVDVWRYAQRGIQS
ncbi:hypothetical protein P885DRAFT_40296 [Corynascus similis CBS 632.67]